MMRQYELLEKVLAYNPHADEALLNKAYVYGMQKHGSQIRASGDPYFAHPLEVAAILTELKLDDATIAVALLHDTIEDTDATRAEIDQMFGHEIGAIVEGLTKIERLNLVTREEAQAENLRKLLLAISQDVRVLLVKLADRLHNMRTLEFVPSGKRKRIAQETMDIYAPLAGRMGMHDMRSELEDIAFRTLQPDHYAAITARLDATKKRYETIIKAITIELEQKFAAEGIKAEVSGRVKAPWSIFTKIERKSIALEQLSDMIGFRVIVDDVEDCYRTLGVVHTTWKVVPGRFKDYISVPKYNDYRSIHTTVVGPGRKRVELQIRTLAMHQIAEYGIAAHALYKDDVSSSLERLEKESRAYGWLRSMIDNLTANNSTEDFLEYTKLELFQDQVFCFTPRGRLIALPRGATPIDFAYAVHTELGDTCVGAKINGSVSPLVTLLRSGDEVEITTDANHSPPANWESIAATGKARAAIRRAVRTSGLQRAAKLGRQVLDAILQKETLTYEGDDELTLAKRLNCLNQQEMLVAIGEGRFENDVLAAEAAAVKGKRKRRTKAKTAKATAEDGWFALRALDMFKLRVPGGQRLGVKGKRALAKLNVDTKASISAEGVVPGDRVIGILTPTNSITVYPVHSDALTELHDADVAWLDVLWEVEADDERTFRTCVSISALNKPGSLAQVASTIAAHNINIHNLFMLEESPDFHKMVLEIELRDLTQLTELLIGLKQNPNLTKVRRTPIAEAQAVAHIDWGTAKKGKSKK